MKKKLVMIAMLFAICFTGFAREVFNIGSSHYVAKAEEKEYTVIVSGEVRINRNSRVWSYKVDRFVIATTSYKKAEEIAKNKFSKKYTGLAYWDAHNVERIRNCVVECESIGDACNYDFSS